MRHAFPRPTVVIAKNRRVLLLVSLVLLLLVITITLITYRNALKASEATAAARLALQVEGFTSALDKYRLLTPILARRPDILAVFSSGTDEDDQQAALEEMVRISGMSGAADIQLTFLDGHHLSIPNSFAPTDEMTNGQALQRPDIVQAMQGRLGRLFLNYEERRFFVFSFASRINSQVVGLVSVIVDLGDTEQIWALSPQPIIAAKDDHVVLSNRTNWISMAILEEASGEAGQTKGFVIEKDSFGTSLIKPMFSDNFRTAGLKYVSAMQRDYVLGWTFYALEPLTKAIYATLVALILASSLAIFALGGLWVYYNRQLIQLRRRRNEIANSLWLERRVESRTRELQQTQEGLIHSAKLAAIGQMSTVLSHEYNQPLTAIRTYAENASLLFEAGKDDKGHQNLKRIENQIEKLAKLSKSLKSFARRPGVDRCVVSVDMVVEETCLLMRPQARKCGVTLTIRKPERELRVIAGHTRLEQVIVNLVANALDAIAEHRQSIPSVTPINGYQVAIAFFEREELAVIQVSDNGPGIDSTIAKDIFEPFITSKDRGVGLGLGLPIAYNLIKGFGGDLRCVEPSEEGMATMFEITLPKADDGAQVSQPSKEEVRPI